jgi:Ca2+:H+ antiporter
MPSTHNSESTPLLHNILPQRIHPDGESGRSGFHPSHFLNVAWRSGSNAAKYTNLLWPFVIVAIVLHFAASGLPIAIFVTSYIAMVPVANLLGFAGQEFARKMPKVSGILIETTFGSIVEIILFVILIAKHHAGNGSSEHGNLIPVIQAAILGSILTNLLLCLGLCFFVGGIYPPTITSSLFINIRRLTSSKPEVPCFHKRSRQWTAARCWIWSAHSKRLLLCPQGCDCYESYQAPRVH